MNEIDRITGNTIRTDADLKYTGYLYPEDETGGTYTLQGLFEVHGVLPPFLQGRQLFVTFCLLPGTTEPFLNRVYSQLLTIDCKLNF